MYLLIHFFQYAGFRVVIIVICPYLWVFRVTSLRFYTHIVEAVIYQQEM
jgi:hypothetical protein